MKEKILVINRPYEKEECLTWGCEVVARFNLDEAEVAKLEEGGTLWWDRNTALSLEGREG